MPPVSNKTDALLKWLQRCTEGYPGVNVTNFTTSWKDGLALCALMHHFAPEEIDFSSLSPTNAMENLDKALAVGEKLGVDRLIDPEDVCDLPVPEKLSMITYFSSVYQALAAKEVKNVVKETAPAFDEATLLQQLQKEEGLNLRFLKPEEKAKEEESNEAEELERQAAAEAQAKLEKEREREQQLRAREEKERQERERELQQQEQERAREKERLRKEKEQQEKEKAELLAKRKQQQEQQEQQEREEKDALAKAEQKRLEAEKENHRAKEKEEKPVASSSSSSSSGPAVGVGGKGFNVFQEWMEDFQHASAHLRQQKWDKPSLEATGREALQNSKTVLSSFFAQFQVGAQSAFKGVQTVVQNSNQVKEFMTKYIKLLGIALAGAYGISLLMFIPLYLALYFVSFVINTDAIWEFASPLWIMYQLTMFIPFLVAGILSSLSDCQDEIFFSTLSHINDGLAREVQSQPKDVSVARWLRFSIRLGIVSLEGFLLLMSWNLLPWGLGGLVALPLAIVYHTHRRLSLPVACALAIVLPLLNQSWGYWLLKFWWAAQLTSAELLEPYWARLGSKRREVWAQRHHAGLLIGFGLSLQLLLSVPVIGAGLLIVAQGASAVLLEAILKRNKTNHHPEVGVLLGEDFAK